MKHTIILLIAFCFLPLMLAAQFTLTIEITGLRNSKGMIHGELHNEENKPVANKSIEISDRHCCIVFDNLQPGKYSFKYIHDENKNDKLDTNWLGIPKEGFGYSNNPALIAGPPSLKKTIFELNESKIIKCKTIYL